jgi:hypothetical protein
MFGNNFHGKLFFEKEDRKCKDNQNNDKNNWWENCATFFIGNKDRYRAAIEDKEKCFCSVVVS